jgi:peptide/nickel transport system permease protein
MATTADVVSLRREEEREKSTSLWRDAARRFVRHPVGMTGAALVTLLIFTALFGPSLAPHNPNDFVDFSARFSGPTIDYPMGLDDFGRDIFSRIIYGAQVSLRVGIIAVGIAAAAGTFLGMIAGFSGRMLDEIIMRLMDILFAFPPILLAIAIMAALGKGVTNAMIAIGIVYIPIFARIARGATLSIKEEDFILASRAIGADDGHIIRAHIFPNIVSPIIVEITLSLSFAILAEAALSFFGLGTQIPDPSWGRMLKEGQTYYQQSIWMSIFPGLAIMLTVMGFNFLGDGVRDALDPKMKNV